MMARVSLTKAAKALGGNVAGRNSIVCPGPGHSTRDRSLSITFTPKGFAVHSHAGDDWRACRDYVAARLDLDDKSDTVSYLPPSTVSDRIGVTAIADDSERTARAMTLWQEARPLAGTPAEIYLASRGLPYGPGEALRWHTRCPFGPDRVGAMVALVRNIVTDAPQAIHRTAIDAKGRKLAELGSNGRLSLGPVAGGAIKLSDDADVTLALGLAEGIESALSIRCLPDLAGLPVWACLSAGGMKAFPALPGVETVWIGVDNDHNGTGQAAARAAAERLALEGIEVITVTPDAPGRDLNDGVRHA